MMSSDGSSVAVVGSGPAGAAAALVLARAGCRVELIDRRGFPRDKACGDALTAPALRLLDQLELGWIRSRTLTLQGARIHPDLFGSFSGPAVRPDTVHMIRRYEFDAMVREAALEAGAVERHARVLGVSLDEEGSPTLTVESDSGDAREIRFSHAIGADGAGSVIARDLGLHLGYGTHSAWSMRTYVHGGGPWEARLELIDSSVLGLAPDRGFGWVLPVSEDGANVGVYVHGADGSRWVPAALDRLLDVLGKHGARPAESRTTRRGGWIRHDFHPNRSVRGRVLLAGDAAGLSSAVTGEGIAVALGSGIRAAEVVLDHLGNGTPLGRYGLELDRMFGGWIRQSRRSVDRGTSFALPRDEASSVSAGAKPTVEPNPPFEPGIVVVRDEHESDSSLIAELELQLQERPDLLTTLDRAAARRWGLPIDRDRSATGDELVLLIDEGRAERFVDPNRRGVGELLDRLDSALVVRGRRGI